MKMYIWISILCFTLLFQEYYCIVGGSPANMGSIPYQVAILDDGEPVCSGSLISNQWVLTAASCARYRKIIVVLGTTHPRSSGQAMRIPVDNIVVYPEAHDHENDIALINLPMAVKFNEFIKPINLADDNGIRGSATVSGWGRTKLISESSDNLLTALVELEPNQICQNWFLTMSIRSTHICTTSVRGNGACSGDTGAPLVHYSPTPVLIGIVTKPLLLCTGLQPTVYTRVSTFKEWIQSKIETRTKKKGLKPTVHTSMSTFKKWLKNQMETRTKKKSRRDEGYDGNWKKGEQTRRQSVSSSSEEEENTEMEYAWETIRERNFKAEDSKLSIGEKGKTKVTKPVEESPVEDRFLICLRECF